MRNNVHPCKPQFYYIKVGCKGCTLHGHVYMMKCVFFIAKPLGSSNNLCYIQNCVIMSRVMRCKGGCKLHGCVRPRNKCLFFQKPYQPYFFEAYSSFFNIRDFSLSLGYFELFSWLTNVKKIFVKIAYLLTLKVILMFPETRHIFCFWPYHDFGCHYHFSYL